MKKEPPKRKEPDFQVGDVAFVIGGVHSAETVKIVDIAYSKKDGAISYLVHGETFKAEIEEKFLKSKPPRVKQPPMKPKQATQWPSE